MSAPLASRARAVSWKDLYLPVPTIKRERNCLPAIINESVIFLLYGPQPTVNQIGPAGRGLPPFHHLTLRRPPPWRTFRQSASGSVPRFLFGGPCRCASWF